MKSTLSGDSSPPGAIDTKPYVRHHPVIGYEYIPGTNLRLPGPGGGEYTIAINSAGIRSSREYSFQKDPKVFRILAFGDSFAAGQYVSSEHRFSEVLERRLSGVEVINFGLEGTGTDQQLLIFEHTGRKYEFDLILLLPFLQNIKRNIANSRLSTDPRTRRPVLVSKPRFELVEGDLVLRNVPVPKERRSLEEAGIEDLGRTDSDFSGKAGIKTWLNSIAEAWKLKKLAYGLLPREPFPEYRSPNTPEWRLMEAIIRKFSLLAGTKPLVIAPLFYSSYVYYRMARNYWDRFASLGDGKKIYAVDVLPYFKSVGRDASRCFHDPFDCHLSVHGHYVLANALGIELVRLGLLPSVAGDYRCTA